LRIISKFHDYYDSIMRYGMDQSVVYIRNTKELEIGARLGLVKSKHYDLYLEDIEDITFDKDLWLPLNFRQRYVPSNWDKHVIGFCGKLYFCYSWTPYHTYDEPKLKKSFIYNIDDYIKVMKKVDRSALEVFSRNKKARMRTIDIFKNIQGKETDSEIFRKFKIPIFSRTFNCNGARDSHIKANCNLKNLGFYKVMDPFTTFQNIAGYLSGVLGTGENEIVDIKDEDMLRKKGFNEWSFKTLPGTKKPRRKGK